MIRIMAFAMAVTLSLLLGVGAAHAQQAGIPRIGVLINGSASNNPATASLRNWAMWKARPSSAKTATLLKRADSVVD